MELATKFKIAGVPTIIVFKNGEVVERMTGFRDQVELQGVIDSHLES